MGWDGTADLRQESFVDQGLRLIPVPLSAAEVASYYEGFSNGTIWPLYHDVVVAPEYDRAWWDAYVRVNQRFADLTAQVAERNALVWVQDYQLQLVPQMLRKRRPDVRIGFFLHIPFPPLELFQQLPWRNQIISGLLGADLVGFQVPGAARNFLGLVRRFVRYQTWGDRILVPDGRSVLVRAYPIAIDAQGFQQLATSPDTVTRAAEIRRELGSPKHLFLGVDRLDYTKGIKQRLRAFSELLTEGSLDADDCAFVQVATPSRERVDQYQSLRNDIDQLVGRVNGEMARIGRQPITYLPSFFPRSEIAAMYRAADVMVVTSLRDGMNLVAKEYIACCQDDGGALVLSEFAGAAKELGQAYLVNPYDIEEVKSQLLRALSDNQDVKARRMRAMRRQVFSHDIQHWAETFLHDLDGPVPA